MFCVFQARSEKRSVISWNTKHFHCFSPPSEPINHGTGTNHGSGIIRRERKSYEQYSCVFVKMLSELVSSSHSKVSLAVVKGDSGMNVESSDTIQHNEVLINDQNEYIYTLLDKY